MVWIWCFTLQCLVKISKIIKCSKCSYQSFKKKKLNKDTINFHFTQFIVGIRRISFRVGGMCSIVVKDDVLAVLNTSYVGRIWYRRSIITCILKAQNTIFFTGRVRDINWESKISTCVFVVSIYQLLKKETSKMCHFGTWTTIKK